MAARTIIRGDSYGIRRPLYTITLVDEEAEPFDLTDCSVFTTYKVATTEPLDDPTDTSAPIKHELEVDSGGVPITQDGLYLVGSPTAGIIEERLTSAESASLPLAVDLISDIQLIDQNGEVFTWLFTDTLRAVDGVTNRES
jgi:hypothetical protein